MQQVSTNPVALFLYMVAVYPVCGALMFYRPLQCRPGRSALWWVGIMGSMVLKAAVQLAQELGACPYGTLLVVSSAVSFVAPMLLLYCFEEPLALKGICFFVAVVVDSAITAPGIVLANYCAAHVESKYLPLGYLGQAVLQFISLYITVKILRIAKERIRLWNPRRVDRLGMCGGGAYLLMVCVAAVSNYHRMGDNLLGLLVLAVTVLMLEALLFAVLFEAYGENVILRGAVNELNDCRTMQYNALRMQQKTLDALHLFQHDIKNHYLALQGFLARGEVAQAEDYLRELTENAPAPAAHYAENPIADVALADAALRCEEQDIAFTVGGVLPAAIPMTATDLGCLLYNLLSNAIEGALRGPTPRRVAIRFAVKAGQLCITVTNTAQPDMVVHGGTSKADAQNHGFGTRIIHDIAERYNGVYVLRMNEGVAEADTMLSLDKTAGSKKITIWCEKWGGVCVKSAPMLLVAVCDDNAEILAKTGALVKKCLADVPHRVDLFEKPQEMLLAAVHSNFGLAILDIVIKEKNGIQVAGDLQARCPGCRVIFLTSYLGYAQDVYDVEHIGFVLKEEMQTRLPVALERFCRDRELSDEKTVSVNDYGTLRLLRQNKIRFLERHLRTTDIHCVESDVSTGERLEEILERLDAAQFCQCHKSYIVNWAFVESFSGDALHMKDGTKVPVSRRNVHRVREALFRYAMHEADNIQ